MTSASELCTALAITCRDAPCHCDSSSSFEHDFRTSTYECLLVMPLATPFLCPALCVTGPCQLQTMFALKENVRDTVADTRDVNAFITVTLPALVDIGAFESFGAAVPLLTTMSSAVFSTQFQAKVSLVNGALNSGGSVTASDISALAAFFDTVSNTVADVAAVTAKTDGLTQAVSDIAAKCDVAGLFIDNIPLPVRCRWHDPTAIVAQGVNSHRQLDCRTIPRWLS